MTKKDNDDMVSKIKKQNPGVKVKRVGGGIQIVNPRSASSLLTKLIKKLDNK